MELKTYLKASVVSRNLPEIFLELKLPAELSSAKRSDSFWAWVVAYNDSAVPRSLTLLKPILFTPDQYRADLNSV